MERRELEVMDSPSLFLSLSLLIVDGDEFFFVVYFPASAMLISYD